MLQTIQSVIHTAAGSQALLQLAPALQRAATCLHFSSSAIADQDRIFQNIYGFHDTSLKVTCRAQAV